MRISCAGKITDRKIVVGLFAGVPGIGGLARGGNARGRGRTVVAVGDIERGHGVERCGDARLDRGVADHPQGVAHAVEFGIGIRRAGRRRSQDGVDLGRGRVGQQHRAGLGVERVDLAHAVVFLVGAGELVLADAVGVVVRHRSGGHDAGLAVAAHHDAVGVVAGRRVAHQHAGLQSWPADFRRPWRRPRARRDRCPRAGRFPAWKYAGSSTAGRLRARGLRRWTARRRAGRRHRWRVPKRGGGRRKAGSDS